MARDRFLHVVEVAEVLPDEPADDTIYLVGPPGQPYSVNFACPCSCGQRVHLLVNRVKLQPPSWVLTRHENGTITLAPSILWTAGCLSHFFIRENRVIWC